MVWIIFISLSTIVTFAIAVPLIRKAKPIKTREQYDLQVYQDQLSELEEDKKNGLLTVEQEQSARLEIDRRLLGLSKTKYKSPERLIQWRTALILIVLVPLISVGLYFLQGSPEVPDQPLSTRVDLVNPIDSKQILNLIAENLEEVKNNPDNPRSWIMLGRSYLVAGRFEESIKALRNAVNLGNNTADLQMELFEALLNQSGGTINSAAQRALNSALELDPLNPAARFYNGIFLAENDQLNDALEVWIDLANDTPQDAPWIGALRNQIEMAAKELNINVDSRIPSIINDTAEGIAGLAPNEQMELIMGMVNQLAERLEENPDDPNGWLRLSQSYQVLGQNEEALSAIRRATLLLPDDPDILLQEAVVIINNYQDTDLLDKASQNIIKLLKLKPDSMEGLYYSGVIAEIKNDYDQAKLYWTKLLLLLDPSGEAYVQLKDMINKLNQE